MKKIILVRHGRAVKKHDNVHDFKRALVQKGEKETEMMVRAFKKESFKPDLIISSPADRTLETAHIYARKLGYPLKTIRLEDVLYHPGTSQTILQMIQGIPDEYTTVMLFGHNPSLTGLVRDLVPEFEFTIPKSGVAGIEFPVENWKNIAKGNGQLCLFDYPVTKKQKAQVGKTLRHELSAKLSEAMGAVIENADPAARAKMNSDIEQASRKLSGKFIRLADHLIVQTLSKMKLQSVEDDEEVAVKPVTVKKTKSKPVKKSDADKTSK